MAELQTAAVLTLTALAWAGWVCVWWYRRRWASLMARVTGAIGYAEITRRGVERTEYEGRIFEFLLSTREFDGRSGAAETYAYDLARLLFAIPTAEEKESSGPPEEEDG